MFTFSFLPTASLIKSNFKVSPCYFLIINYFSKSEFLKYQTVVFIRISLFMVVIFEMNFKIRFQRNQVLSNVNLFSSHSYYES